MYTYGIVIKIEKFTGRCWSKGVFLVSYFLLQSGFFCLKQRNLSL